MAETSYPCLKLYQIQLIMHILFLEVLHSNLETYYSSYFATMIIFAFRKEMSALFPL